MCRTMGNVAGFSEPQTRHRGLVVTEAACAEGLLRLHVAVTDPIALGALDGRPMRSSNFGRLLVPEVRLEGVRFEDDV